MVLLIIIRSADTRNYDEIDDRMRVYLTCAREYWPVSTVEFDSRRGAATIFFFFFRYG